jgi:quercetin dioxygenase-like cupin family protein
MKLLHFSSSDFAGVRSFLTAARPEKIIHKNVLKNPSSEAAGFSAERHHLVRIVDLPSKVLSMTLGGLQPGQSTRVHRHNYETLIYILDGRGTSRIGDVEMPWVNGDALYIPAWAWHQHTNLSDTESALYIACENAPQLQNLGIALREEK